MDGFSPMPRSNVRLFVDVSEIVAKNLARLAESAGCSRNRYVNDLFLAAYSAKCAPSGDKALDAAVRGVGSGAPDNPPHQGSGGRRHGDVPDLAPQLRAATARTAAAEEREQALARDLVLARTRISALEAERERRKAPPVELAASNEDKLRAEALAAQLRDSREALERANAAIEAHNARAARQELALAATVEREHKLAEELSAATAGRKLCALEGQLRDGFAGLDATLGALRADVLRLAKSRSAPAKMVADVEIGESSAPDAGLQRADVATIRAYLAAGNSDKEAAEITGFTLAQIASARAGGHGR